MALLMKLRQNHMKDRSPTLSWPAEIKVDNIADLKRSLGIKKPIENIKNPFE